MKNKNTGFNLIEIILSVVILGILVTIIVPTLVGAFAKSRDAERTSNVQKTARLVLINEAEVDTNSYMYTNTSLRALTTARGMSFPESNSAYCYVYGYAPGEFFAAIRAESKDNTFFIDGTNQGQVDFGSDNTLKSEITNCSPLSSPTAIGSYTVFYLQ